MAYEAICEKITSGQFKAGFWLRQETLSRQLGISHTPIRESLDRLVSDGLAERVPNKGVRVSSINEDEIADVYALRLLLEPLVARLAAQHASFEVKETLSELIDAAARLETPADMPARMDLNREFHSVIAIGCGSRTLRRLYELVWNRYPDWMFYEGLPREPEALPMRLEVENREHRELRDAIIAGDFELAEQISLHHVRTLMDEDRAQVLGISEEILADRVRRMGLLGAVPD